MAETPLIEKVEIVKYCIEHQNNYSETAQKYQVSYQQVYTWTNKYENYGVESLQDKRGKRKNKSKLSELEKLKAQNKLLEAQNRRQAMEIDFLKTRPDRKKAALRQVRHVHDTKAYPMYYYQNTTFLILQVA